MVLDEAWEFGERESFWMVLDEAGFPRVASDEVRFVLPLAAGIARAGIEDGVTRKFQVGWLVSSLKCVLATLLVREKG